MKKIIIMLLAVFIFTGCTIVRIDTDNIDTIINVVLSKDNTLYNTVGKGYKYYRPRGVNYIDTTEYNEKLYSNGYYYYLYVDINSYYYKKEFSYKENPDAYYSKYLEINDKLGYVEINKFKGLYLIEFVYNYAKIEALVEEEDINQTILDATYILSTIKYNSNVIKIMLNEDYFTTKEERYDIFTPKGNVNSDNEIKYDQG
ncbi:MAG: hypothetical protein II309_03825 [Bacilli bacterium]|nr:hypothetical protein [Bacilli bacterium]